MEAELYWLTEQAFRQTLNFAWSMLETTESNALAITKYIFYLSVHKDISEIRVDLHFWNDSS